MTNPMPKTINVGITETIRHAEFQNIKPSISAEFDVPEDCQNLQQFYIDCYKVVKKVWNMHLYNMLFNTQQRKEASSLMEFAGTLVTGKEKMPKFKFKEKE